MTTIMAFIQNIWQKVKLSFLLSGDPDAKIIQQLKTKGVDLAQPQWIDFFFNFDKKEDADLMSKSLQGVGFGALVYTNDTGSHICQAKKNMLIELRKMQTMTTKFRELAIRMGGAYEGWNVSKSQTTL